MTGGSDVSAVQNQFNRATAMNANGQTSSTNMYVVWPLLAKFYRPKLEHSNIRYIVPSWDNLRFLSSIKHTKTKPGKPNLILKNGRFEVGCLVLLSVLSL
jgi:hypothetical protein